jgi:hypothetical protein
MFEEEYLMASPSMILKENPGENMDKIKQELNILILHKLF